MAESQVLKWRGKDITPETLMDIVQQAFDAKKPTHERIKKVRKLRRMEPVITLAPSWQKRHPEHAEWVVSVLPERRTLERDLKAAVGAVAPMVSRAPIGFLERDGPLAEECEAYFEEVRKRRVPYQRFSGKAVEDGEYGVAITPGDLDMDGRPDFFDLIDARAWKAKKPDERKGYVPFGDRKGRYVKVDGKGRKQFNAEYDRDKAGRTRKQAKDTFERDHKKSKEAHEDARRQWLLKHDAATIRIIPALDCAPFMTRGVGRDSWDLTALCQRTLYDRTDIEQTYGWKGMGEKALIPRAHAEYPGGISKDQLYVYTVYTTIRDDQGCERPQIWYCVGGVGTWHSGADPDEPQQQKSVAVIDLYDEYGLEGKGFFGYFGGLKTEDDDIAYAYEPYLWPLHNLIISLEGNRTAINASNAQQSFTGYMLEPDAKLAEIDPDALVDAEHNLRLPVVPKPGEIETAVGRVVPFAPQQVGRDAWMVYQADRETLREATAIDQAPVGKDSGHAQVVANVLGRVAKRDIRDESLAATKFALEAYFKIVDAQYRVHDVKWPITTTAERAVGADMVEGHDVAEYNPEWVKDSQNFQFTLEYPEEENLARIDLEMDAAERGFGTFADVQKARGKPDIGAVRVEQIKDMIWRSPEKQAEVAMRVAKLTGNQTAIEILKMQKQEDGLTQAGIPGMEEGVPKGAIRRRAQQGASGGPSMAAQSRGGIQAAEYQSQSNAADDMAKLQVGAA